MTVNTICLLIFFLGKYTLIADVILMKNSIVPDQLASHEAS